MSLRNLFRRCKGRPGKHLLGRGERGFTLVELMIAAFLSTIVMFAIGTMLVTKQRYWDRTSAKLTMIREASAAMGRMSRELRTAKRDSVFVYGDSVQIWKNGACVRFRREGADLVLREGASAVYLVDNTLDSLYFSYAFSDSSAIGVHLGMADGEAETQLGTIVGMRN